MSDARRLWQLADLLTPMAVRVAATLRLADHLADRPRTAPELAAVTGSHAGTLARLLRHLASVGVVREDEGGTWALAPLGEALRDDHPARLRARLDVEHQLGRGDLAAIRLLHSVRTGEAAYPALWGQGFWDDLAADPERTAAFDDEMGADAARWAAELLDVDTLDWGVYGHVVDVGGGNGTLLAELLRRHPGLRGTVVDQPATAAAARATLAAAGLDDRADAVGQSFFDPLPTGGGAYVLCAVVHNWDDEGALAVLRRCAEAAASSSGRVLVIEKIGTDGATPGSAVDLALLVYQGGAERSLDDLVALVERAGLRVDAVHHADAIAVVEAVSTRD